MKNQTLPSITRILLLFTLLCAVIASVQSAHAITVTNTNDNGAGSLRQALADASDGDTIDFSVTGTITLTSGELLVNKNNLTISGPGPNQLIVQRSTAVGTPAFRVFHISSGKTVTISGLTITKGYASGNGGGIYNDHATLTVSDCTISGNYGIQAGGIYNDHATLTVSDCTISGNAGPYGGGGIYNFGEFGDATLTVSNSTLSGNFTEATGDGGGILNVASAASAIVTISNSTLSGNFAGGGYSGTGGGGVANSGFEHGNATLTVKNSTFSGNSANLCGGISNSTDTASATLTIGGTILNDSASGANILNLDGTVTSLGYNVSSDAAGGDGTTGPGGLLNATGDIRNTSPILGPLQDNGGPTFTHELLTGSPALAKGKNFNASTTDQRGTGFARTYDDPAIANATAGDGTDIGAFEVQAQAPAYAAQIQQPINADGTSVFNVRRGVVPVKFALTLDGVATCDLPSATIAVTRTAGGVIGPIDESSYTGPADTGSNFRIDSCQYIYNLSASALGTGTYRVDIIINGQVVGSATFALR